MERGEAMGKPGRATAPRPHRGIHRKPDPVLWPPSPAAPTTARPRWPPPPFAGGAPRRHGRHALERLSVVELRALLRDYPIDRTSLPAPIENLRREELVEALRQVNGLYENTKDQRFTPDQ
jgi:hypothetical protein